MLSENKKIEIGERIRKERVNIHMSQMDFSESIDISVNFLSEIETGKKGFSAETLYNLCKAHNISSDYILFGPQKEKSPNEQIVEISQNMTSHELRLSIDYLTALLKMKEARDNE